MEVLNKHFEDHNHQLALMAEDDVDADDFSAGEDAHVSVAIPGNVDRGEVLCSPSSSVPSSLIRRRTSELTIAFEGEVYVFPAVTPDKASFLTFFQFFFSIFFVVCAGRKLSLCQLRVE